MRLREAYTKVAGIAIVAGGLAGCQTVTNSVDPLKAPDDVQDVPKSYSLSLRGEAKAPYGHVDFCKRLPEECSKTFNEAHTVVLSDNLRKEIEGRNLRVNSDIDQKTDLEIYGQVEYWTYPKRMTDPKKRMTGDCEDISLEKRRLLHTELKIPLSAMSMVVVIDEVGEGHAVLAIRTDKGDLILDNKRPEILFPFQTGYTFIKTTDFQNFGSWRAVAEVRHVPEKPREDDAIAKLIQRTTGDPAPRP